MATATEYIIGIENKSVRLMADFKLAFGDAFVPFIVLTGENGSGKTLLLKKIFEALIQYNMNDKTAYRDNEPLNRTAYDAHVLAVEAPVFIHPAVDYPEHFFEFLPTGVIAIKEGLNNWDKNRAKKMLDKFLNRPSLVEKRLAYIERLKADLERDVNHFRAIIGHKSYDKNHLKLAFFSSLNKIFTSSAPDLEFSRLGYFMSAPTTFYAFFLSEYEEEVQKLILQAVALYTTT
jgi:hypothetical protein